MKYRWWSLADRRRRWAGTLPTALLALLCLSAGLSLNAYDMPVKLPGGSHLLRWPVRVPAEITTGQAGYLRFTAYTTTGTVKPVLITLEFANRDGDWYQTARNLSIGLNVPRELVLDMAADSADWIPAGHFRPWDGRALDGVTAILFRVSASETVDLTVHLSAPVWHAGETQPLAAAFVTVNGYDAKRSCWRAQTNAPPGAIHILGGEIADTTAWPVQAYAPGPVAGEWHPVGPPQFAWRSGGGGVPNETEAGFQVPGFVGPGLKSREVKLAGGWWQDGTKSPSEHQNSGTGKVSATPATPGTLGPRSAEDRSDGGTTGAALGGTAQGSESGTGGVSQPGSFASMLRQMHVGGRLLIAASGPEPALTGQPAQWRLYTGRRWQPVDGADVEAQRQAWKAPNFIVSEAALKAQVPQGPRPGFAPPKVPGKDRRGTGSDEAGGTEDSAGTGAGLDQRGWLDPKVSWAWEEALAAARAAQVELPAVLWADRDLYEFGAYRWGLNPWRAAAGSPRTIFQDDAVRGLQRAVFEELLRRFDQAGGVREWRVALTLPLEGETALVDCYCTAAPAGTRVLISHPACMGERAPIWKWQAGAAQWRYPTGWDSLFQPRLYPSLAPEVSGDFVLLTGEPAGRRTQSPAARLVLRAKPTVKADSSRWADNLSSGAYLDIDLEAVGRGTEGRLAVDVVTGDWLRYQVLTPELLQGNQRKRVRIALGDDSPLKPVQCDLIPGLVEKAADKSAFAWRAERMRRIREVAISFFRTEGPVQVRVYRMAIHPTRPGDAATPPAVVPLVDAGGGMQSPVVAGSLVELDAQVQPAPLNPYDIEETDLRLAVIDGQGRTLEVPAFWLEPHERRTRKIMVGEAAVDAEEMAPAGFGRFRARLRLREAGTYKLEWRLYRGGRFEAATTRVFDYRYSAEGEGLPFPKADALEKIIQTDERIRAGGGAQLYGEEKANRPVAKLKFVTGELAAQAEHGTLTVVAAAKGQAIKYVRVSPHDPNAFEFDDGSYFYPVGVNARSPSDARVPFQPNKNTQPYDANFFTTLDKRATYQFDEFFQAYQAHGINWARIWMSSWWLALEWRRDYPGFGGVGQYNQIHAARLDHLLKEAEKTGVYVQVTLNNHGMYAPEIDTQWEHNPYNKALGGPCASMLDFFSQAEPQKWHLMRLRYVVARWGQSPAIHAWEICSEVEFVGEYGPHYADYERGLQGRKAVVIDDWHRSVAQWLKQWDVQGKHIVTTHYSHPYQGQSTLAMKEMEAPMANAYSTYPDMYSTGKDPKDTCEAWIAADAYWNGFRDPKSQGVFAGFKQFRKPVLIGEHGRHWMGVDMRYKVGTPNTPANLLADMHCMLWAQYMRPYAGDTGFWWWLPLHFEKGWLDHYGAFAQFIAGEDRRGMSADGSDGRTDRDGIGCMAFFDGRRGRGFAWLFQKGIQQDLNQAAVQSGAHWTLEVGATGPYEIEYWHTLARTPGEPLKFATKTETVAAGQTKLTLALPEFKGDLAVKIRRVPAEGAR